MWSIAMTFALRNKNKLGFIDGSCKKDPSNPGLANQWDMCNSVVVTWILNSLSPELFAGAIYTKTASEIWNELKETYDKVDGSVVFNLYKNINSLNQNGSTLADYYNKLNSLWKQFDVMFLMGLDESYLAIRSNLLTKESLLSVKTAFSVISGEESHRNVTSVGTTKPAATAFAAKTFDNKKKNSNSNFRPMTSNNASADVHSNGVSSNNATTGNSHVSFSSDQLARLMNLLNENGVSTANANMADVIVGNISLGWIVDSGANQHMTASAKNLTNVDLKANKNVGIRKQFNGLYLFDVNNACKTGSNNYIATCFISKTLWHQRLGHPADQVFDVLKTILNLDSHSNENPKRPNDEGRVSSNDDGPELSPDINQGNDDSGATSMDETNNTHPEGTVPDETDFINDFYKNSEFNSETEELPVHTLRSVEPTCYEEAILDSNWVDAMNAEIEALNENHTREITDLPPNRKAIENKWIYKIKYKSSGDVDRYKARLVAKSFNQKEGIDFDETFSPVVKMSTVRCVVALYVTNNWPLFQLDVNNAFLYGDLDEDIYMTISKGFASKDNKNKVCKLVKSLYGLKQAPRKCNEKLVSILKENGFVQSSNDHSLFTKSKSNKFIALLVYVYDTVITGNCVNEINKFKILLKSKFKIKDLGHLKYFLGTEVIKTEKDLCLSQRKYCLELLKEYGLLGCKPVSTPMEPNSVLPYIPSKDVPLLDNITGYQKLLGKLIYLTHTRPDIAYSVHCLAQYMHSPLKSHLNCALNVLRYLKGAPGKGIRYNYGECNNNLSGYSDADWAKCLKTRKSVTGYCVFFNNCLISWKSKKQNTISNSSTEAEYESLSSAACEIIWIQKLLLDLNTKVSLPIDLHCDNKFALQLAINPVFHERSKHFEIDVHFIREKTAKGLLNTKKNYSSDQTADILTKHLWGKYGTSYAGAESVGVSDCNKVYKEAG
ncbi:ribonuclease H-like domain-containing protein, partial [Tanacetum coccineum]